MTGYFAEGLGDYKTWSLCVVFMLVSVKCDDGAVF